MSSMGHSGLSLEDNKPEMKEPQRKNITTVLQRLSDKQSSGYESEKEGEIYTQTPTEPGIPSIDEGVGPQDQEQDILETVRTSYTSYEQVLVRESSKVKQEGWMKYQQQEFIQQSSQLSSSHSVCYPKPLPSTSAFHVPLESEHKERKAETVKQSFDDHSKVNPMIREPVIVPRHQSPFYRPHLWKSATDMVASHRFSPQALDQDVVDLEDITDSGKHTFESRGQSSQSQSSSFQSHPRNIELFPPPECIISPSTTTTTDKRDTPDVSEKKDSSPYPKNYKKYLQERYLSSLKEPEPKKAMPDMSSSVDLPKKRLDEIKSESDRKNPSFSSTDSEGREVAMHSDVFIHVRDADDSGKRDDEEGAENKDDVFETSEFINQDWKGSTPQKIHRGPGEEPLDLTSKQPLHPQAAFISREGSGEEMRSPAPFPPQLSPSMYHRSPPIFYSPQHEMVSPRSPLWSVPEGRVFNFNLPSPFEPRCHSDPEFLSPGFSPDSPGLHFTFPPRSPYLGSGGEHSRMPKSPRLVYPGSPSRFPATSNRPLPKLFCSPPQVSDFIRQPDGSSAQGSELTYICPACGQVFPSYDNLAKHMAKHLPTETIKTADNNKVHYCKVCNRAFSRSDMLTRHMRLHTGLKPYECRVCGQVFSRSDHLNTHQRTHTGEKPYRCPQCPYAACRRDMITRHMRIHQKRSSKRGKYLSVPEGESADVRKSSVSSTDTTDSQEHSGRTCSVSSVDSVESESGTRKCSATSGDSFEMESVPSSMGSRLWSSASAESTDFEENPQFRQTSSAFYVDSPGPFLEPTYSYRKSRNWSTTSFESIDSEGSSSRRDSVAEDFGDLGMKDPTEAPSSRDTPVLDDDSLRKFTISSDDIQN